MNAREIKKLVDWIIGFKKISKTKDGYSAENILPSQELSEEKNMAVETIQEKAVTFQEKTEEREDRLDWFSFYQKNEYDEGIKFLEKKLSLTNIKEEIIDIKCDIAFLLQEKNFQEGINYLNNLILDYPNEKYPYYWLSLIYKWKELYAKSLEVAEKGLKIDNSYAVLINLKSDNLKHLGDKEGAKKILLEGIEKNSDKVFLYLSLITILIEEVKTEEVTNWFQKALEIFPENSSLLFKYADFLYDNDNQKEALRHFRILTKLKPDNPTYFSYLGNVYLKLELYNKAMDAYEKANELAKESESWIISNIGNLLNSKGFYNNAIKYFRRALEISPESQYASDRLAKALKNKEEEDKREKEILES